MKRLLLLLWALLLAAPAAAAPGLWVVRDGDTEITLYGTIHALPRGTQALSPAAQARFDKADSLVLETIIPEDKFALANLVTDLGTRPGLKPLLSRVDKAVQLDLIASAARVNMPLAMLDRQKTWLAAVTLSELSLASIGISATDGVEPALAARAKAQGKPVVALESIEQQLGFFNNLPEPDQVKLLEATIGDIGTAKSDTDRLIALWQAGDVETIAREFAREAKASPLLTKILLTNRNRRWADWIQGVMKRPGKVFIAVGAGHFGGSEGLLALLAARGLPAERLEPQGVPVFPADASVAKAAAPPVAIEAAAARAKPVAKKSRATAKAAPKPRSGTSKAPATRKSSTTKKTAPKKAKKR